MRIALVVLVALLAAIPSSAHPGSAIAVGKDGRVYFVDTGAGVFSVDASGRAVRHDGPAFHWFAFDPGSRFSRTPWPSIPGGELHSAGSNPTVILSSDLPVTIGTDGRLYFPERIAGDRVRIMAVEPSGKTSILATLPLIRRGGETIPWINGIAPGPGGSLYYTEDRAVRKIDRRGRVSNVAVDIAVPGCASIPGITSEGPYLRGLAMVADGNVYVAASGCAAVLRVDPKGRVTPILRASPPWSPTAIATHARDVYVLEYLHTASDDRREWLPRVRKIASSGEVTMLANTRPR